MKSLEHQVFVITGASSGLGRALALQLAARGSALALVDIDVEGLLETSAMIEDSANVSTHQLNVADREAVQALVEEVMGRHGQVDGLINNAGVMSMNSIEDISFEDFDWVMSINFYGLVYMTKAFLPELKRCPDAHIVNVSSLNGFICFPGNGVYSCSKHAVKAFTQTLAQELRGSTVNVTSVFPGGMRTNIIRNSRFEKSFSGRESHESIAEKFDQTIKTTPDRAAAIIVKAILKNTSRQLIGPDAHIMDRLTRWFPVLFPKWVAILMQKYA